MEIRLQENGLVGTFRTPEGSGPFPAVLALGGSDGGSPEYFLNLCVSAGFGCLGLAYWGTAGAQPTMVEIPLERIERGLQWLLGRPDIVTVNGRAAVVGASRGGELALLLAATFPDLVGPVVAYTPSSVVWVGVDFTQPGGAPRSSWIHRGQPFPFLPFPANVPPAQSERGMSTLPIFEAGLDDQGAVERAAISIERANGPVLLVSGGDDRVWPAGRMCKMIVDRMSRHERANAVKHLHYPHAGHMLFPYARPSDAMYPAYPIDLGGTAADDLAAHTAAWPHVIQHLRGML